MEPVPETGCRLALLVATSVYSDPELRELRAPGRDAAELAGVLRDPRIGGFEVQTLVNAPLGEVQEGIEDFCADRHPDDQLLIYLSCHGVLDSNGRLYYTAANTRRQRLAATAIAATWLSERLEDSRARRQIVVLDCCHSGAFARGAKGDPDLALQQRFEPHGRGRVVLTASRSTEYSFEGGQASGEGVPSVFTHAIVNGLRTGEADRDKDGLITVTDLYQYVYDNVRSAEPRQTPELWTYGAEGNLLVAHSVRGAVIEPEPLPEDLRVTLESPRRRVRETGVAELADLLDAALPGVALAARRALERIAEEDHPQVAGLASIAVSAPGGAAADQVRRELTERAHREERARQEKARREAEEKARRDTIPREIKADSRVDKSSPSPPAPGSELGEEAPQPLGLRLAGRVVPRLMVFIAIGAVIGLLTAIIIIATLPTPSTLPVPDVRWSYATRDSVYASPAVAGGTVYVGNISGKVYALDAATGHPRWSHTIGGSFSSPAVAGGTVYVVSDQKVYALDAATGHLRWSHTTGGSASGPAVAGGTVYVGSDKVYALDAATGHLRWSHTTGGNFVRGPAVAGGIVYVGSDDRKDDRTVYALDAATGHPRWAYTTGGRVSDPAVAGGTVYVGSFDGKVYALDAATGHPRWAYTTGGRVFASPAVASGTVYVGSDRGKVYALDARL
jgi:outer membrane protein assembly factor BamB